MRLAQHLFYAVAALIGVSLVALKDPALPMAMEMAGGPAATAAATTWSGPAIRAARSRALCRPAM